MFLAGEAVNRTLASGTLVFVIAGNIDEVCFIKSAMGLCARGRGLRQDHRNTGIHACFDLRPTEVPTISYCPEPGPAHGIASGLSYGAELRPIAASICDLMSDDEVGLGVHCNLHVVAHHA